ncbi:MAG: site-specific integrase [Terriglobales bacterium]
MAVYRPTKNSKIWWYDFIFQGQRVRESAKTRSKTVAKDAEHARHREMEESYNGIKRRDRAKLFSVAAEVWLELKSLTLAKSSQRIERDNLKHLRPHFERRLVTDIQAKDVSRYQHARLAEGASPKTVNLEVGTLRAILRRHRVWAEIQQDIRMLPTLDDVGRAISAEEELALLSACLKSRSRSLYPAVMVALNTGMRYSEIRLLQWKQVDFTARILTVGRSKTRSGAGRAIPLNARILGVLEMWAAHFPNRQAIHYVFPFEKYGASGEEGTFGFTAGAVTYDTDSTRPVGDWKEAWEKAKKRAGAIVRGETDKRESPEFSGRRKKGARPEKSPNGESTSAKPASLSCRFHDLRHTAVTRLLEAGIPYPVMASMMGWSAATAIRMAKRYGHIGSQALRDAADVLGGLKIQVGSLKKSPKSQEAENVVVQ